LLNSHNEFKNLEMVKTIENYADYYAIPDEKICTISSDNKFYKHLKKLTKTINMDIFCGNLHCFYIDYAGDFDILDVINNWNIGIFNTGTKIFNSIDSILDFSNHIMKGLNFLHQKNICHLDIKSENIMLNSSNKTFRIIDFGFSSVEPFNDFTNCIRGTPGYFPRHYDYYQIEPGLPKIEANDMEPIKGIIPMIANRKLVYKIDSYCLGRVINFIYYNYKLNSIIFRKKNNNNKKANLIKIIELLTDNNVLQRITIGEILLLDFLW